MPSIKEYNVKLASLRNTRKMTNTMKMVAASKLRRAQEAQRNAQPYAVRLSEMVARLAGSVAGVDHPLLAPRSPVRKVLLLLFTSDRGLCGGFNNTLMKHASRWIEEQRTLGREVALGFCGRRGFLHFRHREEVFQEYEGVTARPRYSDADRITHDACSAFLGGEIDEVYLACNVFRSALSQQPEVTQLLPIEPGEVLGRGERFNLQYTFEPPRKELLGLLLPKTVGFKIYYALLENAAGEHGARMTAMDSATGNADKLIDENTLLRNRARQAAITTELIEIVSGAEAL